MQESKLAWNLLQESLGTYIGSGINHEGQKYVGAFSLKSALPNKLLLLHARATGESGEVFHEEVSMIGPDMMGQLTMYVSSNNHPGVTAHAFRRIEETAEEKKVVFGIGNVADENSFREEITVSLFRDGHLAHHYAWGMPGGSFEPRSGSKMQKV